jgi:hypothetical protein
VFDLGIGRSFPLAPRASWNVGFNASAADRRYSSRTSVCPRCKRPTPAMRSTLPVQAGATCRPRSARSEFGERWVGYVGVSQAWLVDPARRSPLSQQPSSWAVSGGLAWRF